MSGLIHFQTRVAALRFQRVAANGLADDARQRKGDLQDELRILLDSLRVMIECRVDRLAVAEALAPLIDAVSDAGYVCDCDIDAAGQHFDPIDLTEARALLAKVLV